MFPIIFLLPAEIDEATSPISFRVILSEPTLADVTVQYRAVQDGTATVGSGDITGTGTTNTGTLTIPAGQTQATISFFNDRSDADEFDENFTLELSDPVNATLDGGGPVLTATGVVLDSDGGQDRALFVSDPIVVETDSFGQQAVFEIRLSEAFPTDVTLSYTTVDGTATAGQDYTARSGTVTFVAGQTVNSVEVNVSGDNRVETLETFSLVVTPQPGIANGLQDATGIAEIVDDDAANDVPEIAVSAAAIDESTSPISFRVILSEPTLSDVTVEYRLRQDGTATVGSGDITGTGTTNTGLLTIPAGETVARISFFNDRSDADEFDENFTLELSNPVNAVLSGGGPLLTATGVIEDSDGGQDRALFVSDPFVTETDGVGVQAVFEIRLSEPFGQTVSLDYATVDGTAIAGEDYTARSGTLTFLAGQTVASVAVDITGDNRAEALETFSLIVEPIPGIANGLDDAAGIAEIADDDTSDQVPEIAVSSARIYESTSPISFRVTLSEPTLSDVTMQYRAVQDGSATVGSGDITGTGTTNTGTLTIPAGQTVANISFFNDRSDADEFDENFTLELSNPVNAVFSGGGPVLTATGIILDSDGGQNRAVFVSDPIVFEGDARGEEQAVFEIRLSQPFAQAISFNFATADGTARAGSDYAARNGTVTFQPGQTTAAVAVDILGDTRVESLETFSLILSNIPTFIAAEDRSGIASIQNDDTTELPPPPSPPPGGDGGGAAANRPPVVADDGGTGFRTNDATAFTTRNVLANDDDPDGDALTVVSIDTSATRGRLTDNGDGTFRYDPAGAFDALGLGNVATDSFRYRASDGEGGNDTGTVTISVSGTRTVIRAPEEGGGNIVQGSNEDEVIIGNARNNILVGFGGEDVLTGLEGRDVFVLSNARGAAPNVTISDFQDDDLLAVDDQLLGFGSTRIDVRPFTFDLFLDILESGLVGFNPRTGELRIDTDQDGDLELVATLEGAPRLALDDVLIF